ncbi:hypothetical protein ACR6C2_29945 [Streptomyces sp. INA 01156]
MDQNLVFVGSPRTVAERIRAAASEGFFNTVLGEFTFGDIAGAESIASMELFSREVMPLLAEFTPTSPSRRTSPTSPSPERQEYAFHDFTGECPHRVPGRRRRRLPYPRPAPGRRRDRAGWPGRRAQR